MRWATASLVAVLIWVAPISCMGETQDPWSLLDDPTLERLAQDLQAGRDAQALAETLRAALATKDQEITELHEALAAAKRQEATTLEERIRQDERARLHAESIALLKEALAEYRDALKEARAENQALRKQASIDRFLGAIPILGLVLMIFGLGR